MRTIRQPASSASTPRAPLKASLVESLAGVAEAGFLVAVSDGEVVDAELDMIAAVLSGALGAEVSHDHLMDLLEACANALENDGWEGRIEVIASLLDSDEARSLALATAAAVLVADENLAVGSEDEAYMQIAEALGFSQDEAARAIDHAASVR
ncbi:MAG: hypothetical protein EOO75_07165 [Myxococcales bacterium]|nr:MAG: hypothetical protein EOO75_07165 [Myxococcales bacterium]